MSISERTNKLLNSSLSSDKANTPPVVSKVKSFSQKFENGPVENKPAFKPAVPLKVAPKSVDIKSNDDASIKTNEEIKKTPDKPKSVDIDQLKKTLEKPKLKPVPAKPKLENKSTDLTKTENKSTADSINELKHPIKPKEFKPVPMVPANKPSRVPQETASCPASSGTTSTTTTGTNISTSISPSIIPAKSEQEPVNKSSFLQNQLAKSKITPKPSLIKHSSPDTPQKLQVFPKSHILSNSELNVKKNEEPKVEKDESALENDHRSGMAITSFHESKDVSSSVTLRNNKPMPKILSAKNKIPSKMGINKVLTDITNNSIDSMTGANESSKTESNKTKADVIKTYKKLPCPKVSSKVPRKPARPPIVNLNSLSDDVKKQIKSLIKTDSIKASEMEVDPTDMENEETYEDLEEVAPSSRAPRPISLLTEEEEREEEERNRNKAKTLPPPLQSRQHAKDLLNPSRRAAPPVPRNCQSISENVDEELYDDIPNDQDDDVGELYEELS